MFYRNWRKTTDGQNISKALSVKTWDDNANEDDTLQHKCRKMGEGSQIRRCPTSTHWKRYSVNKYRNALFLIPVYHYRHLGLSQELPSVHW